MGILPGQIHVLGRSIGSGPATYVAGQRQVGSLTLISGFASLRKVVEHQTGKFLSFFSFGCPDYFKNSENIKSVKAPVLLIHGLRDTLITVE